MKPHLLELQNFGPFKDRTIIDFDKLGDFFLIYGKTGAGKTTLFDAITYALYGSLPGARSSLSVYHLRSDFSLADAPAFIILTFSIQNEIWRITRTLPIQITTSKNLQTKKTEPILEHYKTHEWELFSAKTTEVNAKIKALIGLSVQEFARIVLLPQGEFAEFLKQTSTDRRNTLIKLFPVEHYQKITERAKELHNQHAASLSQITKELIEIKEELSSQNADTQIQELQKLLETNKVEIAEKRLSQTELTALKTEQQHRLQQCKETAEQRKQLEDLQSRTNEINNKREQLARSQQAVAIKVYIEQEQKEEDRCKQLATALVQKNLEMETIQKDMSKLQNSETLILQSQEQVKQIEFILYNSNRVIQAEQELKEIEQEQKHIHSTLIQKQKEQTNYTTLIEEAQKTLDSLPAIIENPIVLQEANSAARNVYEAAKQKYEEAQKKEEIQFHLQIETQNLETAQQQEAAARLKYTQAKLKLENAQSQLQHEQFASMAASLAMHLQDGTPCPVCGSKHHPQPAQASEQLITKEQLKQAKKTVTQSEEELQSTIEKRISLENRCAELSNQSCLLSQYSSKQAEEQMQIAQQDFQNTEKRLSSLLSISAQREEISNTLITLQKKLDPCNNMINNMTAQLHILKNRQEQCEKTISKFIADGTQVINTPEQSVQQIIKILLDTQTQRQNEINNFQQEMQNLKHKYTELTAEHQVLREQQYKQIMFYTSVHDTLYSKLPSSGFTDVAEARAALLSPDKQEQLHTSITTWEKETTRLTALLSQPDTPSQTEIQTITTTLAQTEQNLQQVIDDIDKLEKRITHYQEQLFSLIEKQRRIDTLEKQRQQEEQESQYYTALFNDLAGKNPASIPFTSWVLSIYLEQIVQAANLRLARISDGRFTLLINTIKQGAGYKGLDLAVFDSYTGKSRPCETLSGGETFMASISLALGLTDIVQNQKGGIILDSLFIDEGFGSLDETALEKALLILDGIRNHRCVGIISHVDMLKSRISNGLEVIKTPAGSSIRYHSEESCIQ